MTGIPADGWSHNSHYRGMLLAALPRPCARALDVGCGLGSFARRLAAVADQVDAIDREPGVLTQARRQSAGIGNLRYIEADFLTWEAADRYDCVSFLATLHHMPFAEALTKAAGLLRPGGVLAVLGLDRSSSWLEEAARSAIAYPVSLWHRLTRTTASDRAPIRDPPMTLHEIRREAAIVLPGAATRRRLLWRYSLAWIKPAGVDTRPSRAPA